VAPTVQNFASCTQLWGRLSAAPARPPATASVDEKERDTGGG